MLDHNTLPSPEKREEIIIMMMKMMMMMMMMMVVMIMMMMMMMMMMIVMMVMMVMMMMMMMMMMMIVMMMMMMMMMMMVMMMMIVAINSFNIHLSHHNILSSNQGFNKIVTKSPHSPLQFCACLLLRVTAFLPMYYSYRSGVWGWGRGGGGF